MADRAVLRGDDPLGAGWMTFDPPWAGVPAMVRAMERFTGEVKPAAA